MTALEITLIIIGVVILVGSFFVSDKLSKHDIDQIAKMSEEELRLIVNKQLELAKNEIQLAIENGIDETTETTKRALERETNEKINGISEFSDTVLESINKSHNEIMFLYSMLNDKHKDLTELASSLQEFSANLRNSENEMIERLAGATAEFEQRKNSIAISESVVKTSDSLNKANMKKPVSATTNSKPIKAEKIEKKDFEFNSLKADAKSFETAGDTSEDFEKIDNEMIMELHLEGKSDVEIAKLLGCGLGEVRLVIGLHKGENR